ncbi:MAG: DUF721 domain-containing protein [Betaproteobacteria bacterium]|nr:DUF721 domain-containing protein [Betaproteobacteria bacterium]MCL2886384.1 DUF721 domain-containing protein [Betaproteobacteria bacterium]
MYQGPEQYLDSDANTSRLMAHARLLLKLSQRFAALVPAGLRHAAHVANYKSGTLIIHAENGAVAAKLRQMSLRLCDDLSSSKFKCSDMVVKVQPRQLPARPASVPPKSLSAQAVASLETVYGDLPAGSLKDALAALLGRVRSE